MKKLKWIIVGVVIVVIALAAYFFLNKKPVVAILKVEYGECQSDCKKEYVIRSNGKITGAKSSITLSLQELTALKTELDDINVSKCGKDFIYDVSYSVNIEGENSRLIEFPICQSELSAIVEKYIE